MIVAPTPAEIQNTGKVFARKWQALFRRWRPKVQAQLRADYEAAARVYEQTNGNVFQARKAAGDSALAGWPKVLYPFWRQAAAEFGALLFADARGKTGLIRAQADEDNQAEVAAVIALIFGGKAGLLDDASFKKLVASGTLGSNVTAFSEGIERWLVTHGPGEIEKLTTTTSSEIEMADKTRREDGQSPAAVILLALLVGDGMARLMNRAIFLTTTEAHAASQIGLLTAAKVLGLKYKGWSSVMDGRERLTHHAAHRHVVPINGLFTVGGALMAYPGDPTAPAKERVNCRCWLYFPMMP